MADSPLIQQVKKLRLAQETQDAKELQRLVDAYVTIHDAAQKSAQALIAKIQTLEAPTQGQLVRLRQYKDMMAVIESELDKYRGFMAIQLKTATGLSLTEGEKAARIMGELAAREMGVQAVFRSINPAVIEQLVGFLDPKGPLYKRLNGLPTYTADQVSEAILKGVGLGKNPLTIGESITRTLGMGLTDSLRMMRTVQLYSYREANRASYIANSDVVTGWTWYAELDELTCASCVAMHGTEHTLDETLDDHHNGRCSMLPNVFGTSAGAGSGSEWFDSLNEEQQKGILGQSKWEAWNEGKFTLADIPVQRPDDVYGQMRTVKSLQELVDG